MKNPRRVMMGFDMGTPSGDQAGMATYGTAAAPCSPPTQLDLAGLSEAIRAAERGQQHAAAALSKLFEDHGYDLANGDVMYHGPDVAIEVPPKYREQVVRHQLLEAGCMFFTRNPRFSLF